MRGKVRFPAEAADRRNFRWKGLVLIPATPMRKNEDKIEGRRHAAPEADVDNVVRASTFSRLNGDLPVPWQRR